MTDLAPVQFEFETVVEWDNIKERCIQRLRHAASLEIRNLPQLEPHTGKCAIVGASPSVATYLERIKQVAAGPQNLVMSVNAAHSWLVSQECPPNIHVVFEDDLDDVVVALGGEPHHEVAYYICSHCSPVIFKQLEDQTRVLWHAFLPPQGYQLAVGKVFPGEFMVAGGYATFFRSLNIALILGYRDFELFGIDSSFENSSHMPGYAVANREKRVTVWGKDGNGELEKFTTQGGLAFQATEFIKFCSVNQAGLRLRVHGDGLLPYLHKSRYPEQYLDTKGT